MCQKYFCQNINQVVRVKDFKYSMKHWQNPMNRQGEIAQYDNFGVKMDIFGQKQFFSELYQGNYSKRT